MNFINATDIFWGTIVFVVSLLAVHGAVPTKYKKAANWTISILAVLFFTTSCFKSCKSVCSFDCSSIDSLRTEVTNEKNRQQTIIKDLETKIKSQINEDSIYSNREKIRLIKYDKVAVYEIMDISLVELNRNCDGCKKSKKQFDSLTNKFNSIK